MIAQSGTGLRLSVWQPVPADSIIAISSMGSGAAMGDFRRLLAWQVAKELAIAVYRATTCFPRPEQYGLTSQIRRAAISICANIAESCGRYHSADQIRLLRIALASARELDCELELANELGFMSRSDVETVMALVNRTEALLVALIRKTRD
ncbi:MAG: four helix bundle protein [Gemmatimonadales bacterium]